MFRALDSVPRKEGRDEGNSPNLERDTDITVSEVFRPLAENDWRRTLLPCHPVVERQGFRETTEC